MLHEYFKVNYPRLKIIEGKYTWAVLDRMGKYRGRLDVNFGGSSPVSLFASQNMPNKDN